MVGVITASQPSWIAPFTGLSPRCFGKLVTRLRREGCQRPFVIPGGGQMSLALMTDSTSPMAARYLPTALRTRAPQRRHALPSGGFGEPERITLRDHDMGMMKEAVDGRGGQGLRHDLVESGRVEVA